MPEDHGLHSFYQNSSHKCLQRLSRPSATLRLWDVYTSNGSLISVLVAPYPSPLQGFLPLPAFQTLVMGLSALHIQLLYLFTRIPFLSNDIIPKDLSRLSRSVSLYLSLSHTLIILKSTFLVQVSLLKNSPLYPTFNDISPLNTQSPHWENCSLPILSSMPRR